MKKLFILFLIVTGAVTEFTAQNIATPIEVKLSETFKDSKKMTTLAFSVEDGNGGVIIGRNYNKGCYIEHFNEQLKLVEEYEMPMDNKRSRILDAFTKDSKLMLVEYLQNANAEELQYVMHKTDMGKFAFESSVLFSIPFSEYKKNILEDIWSKSIFGMGKEDQDASGAMSVSKNRNYIAFYQNIKDSEKESHSIYVFNKNLEKIYEHSFSSDISDRKFKIQNVAIDDKDGTVYLLGKTTPKEAKSKEDGGKYFYELFKIDASGKKSLQFDSDDKFAASLTTVVGENQIICAGFYSDRKDTRYKGVVHFSINPDDLSIQSSKYSPFSDQFIIDKYGKDKDKELRNIVFRNSHVDADNNLILAGEEHFVRLVNGGQMGNSYINYFFMDIIAVKLDPDGDLIWSRNINKGQTALVLDPAASYSSTYKDGKLLFFINGNDKVKKMSEDRIGFPDARNKNMNMFAIEIDEKGDFNYQIIVPEDDADVAFGVSEGIFLNSGDQIIFQGRLKRKKQIAKLTLK